jgi:hypothetical protein
MTWTFLLLLAPPAAADAGALLQEAIAWSQRYLEAVPDFICRQTTTRSLRETPRRLSRPVDTISAEVAVVRGAEEYRWILRDGVLVERESWLWSTGLWSRGEWATMLRNSLDPELKAKYRYVGLAPCGKVMCGEYEFAVERAKSRWHVGAAGRNVYPSYEGRLLIDRAGRGVAHIEMETRDLPEDYPLTYAGGSVDFGAVRIQERAYWLPVKASSSICQREQPACNVNTILFSGHRKFEAESKLSAGEGQETAGPGQDAVLAAVWPRAQAEARRLQGRRFYRTQLSGRSALNAAEWQPAEAERRLVVFRDGVDREPREKGGGATAYTQYVESLRTLLDPATRAEFTYGGVYEERPSPVRIYFFIVRAEHSAWTLTEEGQQVHTGYRGALLVDALTSRVHTLSMRATGLPPGFPLRTAEKVFQLQTPGRAGSLESVPAVVTELRYPGKGEVVIRYETRYAPFRR